MIFTFSTGWIVDHFGYTPVLVVSGLLVPAATAALLWSARNPQRFITEQPSPPVLRGNTGLPVLAGRGRLELDSDHSRLMLPSISTDDVKDVLLHSKSYALADL